MQCCGPGMSSNIVKLSSNIVKLNIELSLPSLKNLDTIEHVCSCIKTLLLKSRALFRDDPNNQMSKCYA